nr:PAS domain S-box protein [Rhizobium halophytocola]
MAFRRAMEESLTVGLRARDHEGRILYVNNAFCQMTGFKADHLTGHMPPMPYWREDRIAETLARHDALNRSGLTVQSFETSFRRSDGSELDVQVFEAPLIDAHGRHRGWMGSVIDISDQKKAAELSRLQAQHMQRTGRLITLGEMASSLAHELNQPLAAIASYAAGSLNILRNDGNPATVIPAIEKLSAQTERAGQIIRRIQDFVRKRDPKFEEVDLASVIAETAAFLATDTSAAKALVTVDAGGEMAPVRADRILLEQLMLNLMRNGIEAMTGTGTGQPQLEVELRSLPGVQVIEIRDRGTGISDTVAERLFQPFVTSKAEGMGMGLSICRTIVELHRGRLEHRPNPGGGTIFSVILPEPEAERPAAE